MSSAILLTGGIRTLAKTYQLIIDHLVIPNHAKIFIFAESDTVEGDLALINAKFAGHLGKVVVMSSTRTNEYNQILQFLLNTKPAISHRIFAKTGVKQDYIVKGGSILEYYQWMKAFNLMLGYEREMGVHFEYVVRSRMDVVFTVPLIFQEGVNLGSELIEKRRALSITPSFVPKIQLDKSKGVGDDIMPIHLPKTPNVYLSLNKTLITFRKNVVWIGKREVMNLLYPLIYFYGNFDTGLPHTFDSETQFQEYAKSHNLTVIDYHTPVEEEYFLSKKANTGLLDGIGLSEARNKELLMAIVRVEGYRFDKE